MGGQCPVREDPAPSPGIARTAIAIPPALPQLPNTSLMMKRGAIISCLIGQLALSAGAHAETQSQVRRVALLDFSAPSTPVAQPTAPIDAVSNGMLLDFRDMRRSEAAAPRDRKRPRLHSST